ncbi:phage gp6-like head-tail connector protein [Sinorhizobium medicae]|uniref:head-tail connector protein n=1 Tax=Sinorhizobium medicae TaxID=110321 RepID=UPI000FD83022|nr:head-tail connector protein [Sinorhizobium medicae]RVI95669.1 phage gp6-like head-tail connector protein [Sinorhizobium medicae]RVQ49513.1 phage gp6-like head-tail connector protein [Sinorhizobium medicae]
MEAVSLADAKAHLRISFTADDAYITGIVEAAEDYVESVGVAFATPIQPAVRHAVLLIVSHFYNNREAVTVEAINAMPFGVNALLQPYREQTL